MTKLSFSGPARAVGAVVAAGLLFTACSSAADGGGSDRDPVSADEFTEAMNTPTELTMWAWVSDFQDQVDLFEARYPNINVTVENAGQGLEHYQKVRTALQAGDGAPDIIQLEYQYLPSFTLTESLLDLSPYGVADYEGDYVDWVWDQVSNKDGVWAVPQDIGPMGNLYRSDIMERAGVRTPPATYDEYAQAARQVKDTTGSYISNLPTNDPVQVTGLLWQAGVRPWTWDGAEGVSIDIDSPESQEVMRYWQDLIQQDLVSTDADFNDQFYQGLAGGKYAGWLTAAWAPVFLQGTAEDTAGLWQAAPLPQWETGQNVSGNWGGSSNAVLSGTENPIAAAEFAKFLNHDPESTRLLAEQDFLFPATTALLDDVEFTEAPVDFFGGQQVNALYSEIADTVDTGFQWLPFMEFVNSAFNETVGAAIGERGDLRAALTDWDEQVTGYARDQGFTVQD